MYSLDSFNSKTFLKGKKMSKALRKHRTELLALCREFAKAELNFITSDTEVNKELVIATWKKLESLVEDKGTARKLAMSQVAEQYLKG